MKTIEQPYFLRTAVLISILLLGAPFWLTGQSTYTSNANGDWNLSTSWTCTGTCGGLGYPNLSTDDVIIDGHDIDIDGSSHNVNSVTLNTSSSASSNLFLMNSASLTVENDLVANKTTNAISELNINNSTLHIKGSADFNNLGINNRLQFQIQNGGQATIDNNLSFEYNPSAGSEGTREILVQGKNGTTASTLNVGQNVELIRGPNGNPDAFDVKIENDAIWNITGNLVATINDDDDCSNDIDIVAGSNSSGINIDGNLEMTNNGGRYLRFDVQSNADATIQGDVSLTHNKSLSCDPSQPGGNRAVIFQAGGGNALADINGDIYFCADRAGDALVSLVNGADLELAGRFIRSDNTGSPCSGRDPFGELVMSNASTLTLDGTGAQNLPPDDNTYDVFEYENVVIDNAGVNCPNYAVTLTGPGNSTIDRSLVLIDGIVLSTPANTLVLDDNVNPNLGNSDSFVDGPVKKLGNDGGNVINLPLGDIVGGNCYCGPMGISNPGNSGDYTGEYFHSGAQDPADLGSGVDNVSGIEHWSLTKAGGNDVKVTLHWKDASESGIDNLDDLIVASYDAGTTWQSLGQGSTTGGIGPNPGSVTSAIEATDYIEFTFGNITNPLPAELISFTGRLNNDDIILNWSTVSEVDNSTFSIEKSNDAIHFNTIGTVAGSGTSSSLNSYQFLDPSPFPGENYYRLKQTDFDGNYEFSNTIVIKNTVSNVEIHAYPNPTTQDIQLSINNPAKEKMKIWVSNHLGETIWQSELINDSTLWQEAFQWKRSGLYFVYAKIGNKVIHKKVIVLDGK